MEKRPIIPLTITVSRETGQVTEVTCSGVREETFRKICTELMKIGRRDERKEGAACSES